MLFRLFLLLLLPFWRHLLHLFLSVFFKSLLQFLEIQLNLFLELFNILMCDNLLRAVESHLKYFRVVPLRSFFSLYLSSPRNDVINDNLFLWLNNWCCINSDGVDRLISGYYTFNALSTHKAFLGALFIKNVDSFLVIACIIRSTFFELFFYGYTSVVVLSLGNLNIMEELRCAFIVILSYSILIELDGCDCRLQLLRVLVTHGRGRVRGVQLLRGVDRMRRRPVELVVHFLNL